MENKDLKNRVYTSRDTGYYFNVDIEMDDIAYIPCASFDTYRIVHGIRDNAEVSIPYSDAVVLGNTFGEIYNKIKDVLTSSIGSEINVMESGLVNEFLRKETNATIKKCSYECTGNDSIYKFIKEKELMNDFTIFKLNHANNVVFSRIEIENGFLKHHSVKVFDTYHLAKLYLKKIVDEFKSSEDFKEVKTVDCGGNVYIDETEFGFNYEDTEFNVAHHFNITCDISPIY